MSLLEDRNAVYLFTAYGVILGALTVYLVALWLCQRNLDREDAILRQIEEESQQDKH
jgi:hypothetical protein